MEGTKMIYNNAVYEIMKTPLSALLLRYMILYGTEQTGRETARNAGLSYVQAHRILAGLALQGIVIKRKAGKAYLFRVNEKNEAVVRLLRPLFSGEQELAKKVVAEKTAIFAGKALSVVLFGSVKEGKERADSDIDVFFLVKDAKAKEEIKDLAAGAAEKFALATGNRLDALVLTVSEYAKAKRERKEIIKNLEQGLLLHGIPLVLAQENDEKTKNTKNRPVKLPELSKKSA